MEAAKSESWYWPRGDPEKAGAGILKYHIKYFFYALLGYSDSRV